MLFKALLGSVVFVSLLTFTLPARAGLINVALGGTASQIDSPYAADPIPGLASKAIDGNTNGVWDNNSLTHTDIHLGSWWQLDLGRTYSISEIDIWNRTDYGPGRLSNFRVTIFDSSWVEVWGQDYFAAGGYPAPELTITLPGSTSGQFVKVQLNGTNYLTLAEVQVLGEEGSAVPEPATWALLGVGLLGLLWRARSRS